MATEGNDTIFGTGAGESLEGLGGNDTIFAKGGNDFLSGGSGNDVLFGDAGDDIIDPGKGNDQIFGGSGTDTVDYYLHSAVYVDLNQGLSTEAAYASSAQLFSIENIEGSLYGDVLIGDDGDNVINGAYGRDTITLGEGRDTYYLSDGNDAGDTITDFQSGEDIIQFHTNEVFRDSNYRPPTGVLGEDHFIEGTQAETTSQCLIYNPLDHTIYIDLDGSGTQYSQQALIYLSEGASVTPSDFLML